MSLVWFGLLLWIYVIPFQADFRMSDYTVILNSNTCRVDRPKSCTYKFGQVVSKCTFFFLIQVIVLNKMQYVFGRQPNCFFHVALTVHTDTTTKQLRKCLGGI